MSTRAEVVPPAWTARSAVHVAAPDPATDNSHGGPTPASNPGFTIPFGAAGEAGADGPPDGGADVVAGVDGDGASGGVDAGGPFEAGALPEGGGLADEGARPMRS